MKRADVRLEVFEEESNWGPRLCVRLTGNRSGVWVEGRCGDNPLAFAFCLVRLWTLAAALQPTTTPAEASDLGGAA